jgi:Fe-S-cluster containining protein
MAVTTLLNATDILPLTCSRTGTCCHGKQVRLNPWELYCFARASGVSVREFRDQYSEFGGIRLRFDGSAGWKGQAACSQYVPNFGCKVHTGRPLACRLYPLGRQRQGEAQHYIYQGKEFPCLEGCPEVQDLPQLTVAEYIAGQGAESFERAQDAYLEIMQNLADGAFALFLESGLAKSGDRQTLRLWRKMGKEEPGQLAKRLGAVWVDCLMLPNLNGDFESPVEFSAKHLELLSEQAQEAFGALTSLAEFGKASGIMMGLALHLGRGLGADPASLAEHWVRVAKTEHGALD